MGNNISNEEKLAKVIERAKQSAAQYSQLEAPLQLIFPPKLFDMYQQITRQYLELSGYDQPSRDMVAGLGLALRQEAFARFGHDTLETFALSKLLKRPDGPSAKQGREDSLTHISRYKNKRMRLDGEQESAALSIREIWQAFAQLGFVCSRGAGGGGKRSRILQPVDVISDELWAHHQIIYSPWYQVASRSRVQRQDAGRADISMAAIVLKILIDDTYPEQIDASYALIKGTALKALKAALSAYHSPPQDGIKL